MSARTPSPGNGTPPADLSPIPPQGIAVGGGRMRVTQRDLDLYSALVGVPQTLLIPAGKIHRDEQEQHAAPTGARAANVSHEVRAASRAWTATVRWLGSKKLTKTSMTAGINVRLARPKLSSWVRRLSNRAKRQLLEAQVRLTAPSDRSAD